MDLRPTIRSRDDLQRVKRIVVKAGTTVVCNPDGHFSLSRLSSIVEQLSELVHQGFEIILVSSGAVGCGRQRLRRQAFLTGSFRDQLRTGNTPTKPQSSSGYNSACASAGQLGIMSLYETLFDQCDIAAAQFLVTSYDFQEESRRSHLESTMNEIIAHGMIPIINENDAVSGNEGYTTENIFFDNDALASLVAVQMNAEALLLLTDVNGLYDKPPTEPGAEVISEVYSEDSKEAFRIGDKSSQGRGGMGAKVQSAWRALDRGVPAVVIASGYRPGMIFDVFNGKTGGTLFLNGTNPTPSKSCKQLAKETREAARALQELSGEVRSNILMGVAQALRDSTERILEANQEDLDNAHATGLSGPLLKRLKLTKEKIEVLASGIESIGLTEDPIGQVCQGTELDDGLVLTKVSVPIGVILIVFESRPDSLPQIASLAIRSGNGLILKGGHEAERSNKCLHRIIASAIDKHSAGAVCGNSLIQLAKNRQEVGAYLNLEDHVDMVIPRGGKSLVSYVRENTRIPVLSHADGICHVFVDKDADASKAAQVIVDSKTDYPAACNAAETVLFHEDVSTENQEIVLDALRKVGVTIKGGPRAIALGIVPEEDAAESLAIEYGDLTILVEVVSDLKEAINHIHTYGSSHTECIITENAHTAQEFLSKVDSACVFHNTSTRFADGYRFGLGAEVGISTGKLSTRVAQWALKDSYLPSMCFDRP